MKTKTRPTSDFFSRLESLAATLEVAADEPSRAAAIKRLDALIVGLNKLRHALSDPDCINKATAVRPAIAQIVAFLEAAKQDARLTALFAVTENGAKPVRRPPIQIPDGLSNQEIRELLGKDLSSSELQSIAAQLSISVHNANRAEIKRAILDNLTREEGYQRLAVPS